MKSWRLWGILILALALRFALMISTWGDPQRAFTPDSKDYWRLSKSLYAWRAFHQNQPSPGRKEDYYWFSRMDPKDERRWTRLSPQAEIFRTPGYPLVLVPAQKLPGGANSALFGQIILDTGLVLLTFLLGRAALSHRAGLLAALFQALSPAAIASSCRILSDGLYAFLLAAAVLWLVSHFKTGRWRSLVASAAALGLACYVRPIGLAMAVIFLLALLLRPKRFGRAGALAAIVLCMIAPWVARNTFVADYFGFSSFATDSMFNYSAPKTLARAEGISEDEARERMLADLKSPSRRGGHLTPGALARERKRIALRVIRDHPATYAGIHLRGCLGFWLPGATDVLETAGLTRGQRGTLEVLNRKGVVAAARYYFAGQPAAWSAVPMVVVLLAKYIGLLGLAAGKLRTRVGAAAMLMVLIVAASALLGGPASTPRFRVPAEPLLSLGAAGGWVLIAGRLREIFSRRRRAQVG